jgi:hypothetical protein
LTRAVGAVVAFMLSVMCGVLAVGASAERMPDMGGMTGAAASLVHVPSTVGDVAIMANADGAMSGLAENVTAVLPPSAESMCGSACIAEVTMVCTQAIGLTVTLVLVLLLASRRDTFLGLLARSRRSANVVRRRHQRTP